MNELHLKFVSTKKTLRALKILNTFERKALSSSQHLSSITQSTMRTVLKDVQELKEYFGDTIDLQSTNSGFLFEIIQTGEYIELKRAMLNHEPLFQLMKNILSQEIFSLTKTADNLHLSESSLARYINDIRPVLKAYSLTITTRRIVDIQGDEINIRHFFQDFFYESEITPHTLFPSANVSAVTLELQEKNFFDKYVSGTVSEFNYTLYIMLERFRKKRKVVLSPELYDTFAGEIDPTFFEVMEQTIAKHLSIKVTKDEIIFIYIKLLCKRSVLNIETERAFCRKFNHCSTIDLIVENFTRLLNPPAGTVESCNVFLESFFTSIWIHRAFSPILNTVSDGHVKYVKSKYVKEWALSKAFLEREFSRSENMTMREIEGIATSLTLFVESMKDLYWRRNRNIAFFLEGNHFFRQSIQTKVMKYMRRYQNLYFLESTELNDVYLKEHDIDIVITNYREFPLEGLEKTGITPLRFNSIPSADDWNRLLELINPRIIKDFSLIDPNSKLDLNIK
ncbi:helix-turn-helix domain-containing protein [Enterococcus sp. AZ109]|uniref:helix-turn-helix domain-containing protein n=1 Tax=Enterococcus sp. AZ109 TaxID=2774634 RepID=UPI003F1E942C